MVSSVGARRPCPLVLFVVALGCSSQGSAGGAAGGAAGAPPAAPSGTGPALTGPSRPLAVAVDPGAVRAELDERFLSFAVDSAQLVGGPFWSPSADKSLTGDVSKPPYDFSRPRLRRMARELGPAYLRVGGSAADQVFVDLSDAPVTAAPAGYKYVLTRAEWDGLGAFAQDLGFDLMVTVNGGAGPRDGAGAWTADNARPLFEYTAQRGFPVKLWELGNEVNAYPILLHITVSGSQLARDVGVLRAALDQAAPGARVGGPSSAYWPQSGETPGALLDDFLAAGGAVDVVTWHYYPQQSRRCALATRRAGPEVMLDPQNLDEVSTWAAAVEASRDARAKGAEVWLGESGNAQCGGEPGVSDAFAGSFWWLDQLGMLARRGQPVTVRQTLSGSNYGLINDDTLDPNPDYWVSLLWRRLMGTRVLDVKPGPDPLLRAYAHCTRAGAPGAGPGSVTLAALNLDRTRAAELTVGGLAPGPADGYVLTAPDLASAALSLNGAPLAAGGDGAPPDLPPLAQASPLLPPLSLGFFVLPAAAAAACP